MPGTPKVTPTCRSCGRRWPQYRGLCRTCERTYRSDPRNQPLPEPEPPALAPRAPRTVTVDGVEFEVVWDGT